MKKICISLGISLLMLVVLAYSASAIKIAYVTNYEYNVNQFYWDKLESLGHEVTFVGNGDIATTDFSQFDMLFVDKPPYELPLQDPNVVPVHTKPSMILNTLHVSNWGWTLTNNPAETP